MNNTGFVFPGGRAVPLSHGWVVVLQLLTFLGKIFLLCSFQILVRWTLPRFRWDQLLRFAWKFLLPLRDCQPGRDGSRAVGAAGMRHAKS